MQAHIFRMNDIRGKVGDELPLSEVSVFAEALAAYLRHTYPTVTRILIGRDGRLHSEAIQDALCQGLQESGLDIMTLGICPTPLVSFGMHHLAVQAGVMITASHNGPEYNGFKIMIGTEPLWGHELLELRDWYMRRARVSSPHAGIRCDDSTFIDQYVTYLVEQFSHLHGMQLPMLFDCANGATGPVIRRLCERMRWPHVRIMYAEVDGTFPHHEADPTIEENMHDLAAAVATERAVCGMGFDGDGDRMAAVTHMRQLVRGDQLLVLYAQDLVQHHKDPAIMYDIKCSQIVPDLLRGRAQPIVSPSGRAIIKAGLHAHGALLAGELSGHYFFADRYFGYDDGIYAALRLMELLMTLQKDLHALVAALPQTYATPELRLACEETEKTPLVAEVQRYFAAVPGYELNLLDGVRVSKGSSWALVRASHTQPVVCIRTESTTEAGLAAMKEELCKSLAHYIAPEELLEALEK